MRDLIILRKLHIKIHPPRAPSIREDFWNPPFISWIKCNTDGAINVVTSSCGGIFRDNDAIFFTGFAENLGAGSSYHAELSTVIKAIEVAVSRGWLNLWIETDSTLVVMAFNNVALIPCSLRNKWRNCMLSLKQM